MMARRDGRRCDDRDKPAQGILAGLALLAAPRITRADPALRLQVWRDPSCGCCGAWIEHMRAANFAVEDTLLRDLSAIRRRLGTPSALVSCHAGLVEGIALEGHVPAAAVRRLLEARTPGISGLAVPGMPVGAPGMEVPGVAPDTDDVIAFGQGRPRAFMRFRGGDPV